MTEKPKIRLRSFVNAYKEIRRVGWKEVWKRWKESYLLSPQEDILKGQLRGYVLVLIGLLIAFFYMIFTARWVYMVTVIGTLWIMYYQTKSVVGSLYQITHMGEQIEKLIREEENLKEGEYLGVKITDKIETKVVCDATEGFIGTPPCGQKEEK